jgi:hypothetical protein
LLDNLQQALYAEVLKGIKNNLPGKQKLIYNSIKINPRLRSVLNILNQDKISDATRENELFAHKSGKSLAHLRNMHTRALVLQTSEGTEYMMLTPDRCLIFPSVDYVRNLVTKHGTKQGMFPVVIDCSHIYGADYTAARVSSLTISLY